MDLEKQPPYCFGTKAAYLTDEQKKKKDGKGSLDSSSPVGKIVGAKDGKYHIYTPKGTAVWRARSGRGRGHPPMPEAKQLGLLLLENARAHRNDGITYGGLDDGSAATRRAAEVHLVSSEHAYLRRALRCRARSEPGRSAGVQPRGWTRWPGGRPGG